MKVLVCGGRDYDRASFLFKSLNEIHKYISITEVIHGGAQGAESLAGDWCHFQGIKETRVPAPWALFGKIAGNIRNTAMLALNPSLVAAFPGGRGTADMCRQAHSKGVLVFEAATQISLEPLDALLNRDTIQGQRLEAIPGTLKGRTQMNRMTAYVITNRDDKSYWNRIGVAFVNKDGSINVKLEAFPVNGEMQLRVPKEDTEEKPAPAPKVTKAR